MVFDHAREAALRGTSGCWAEWLKSPNNSTLDPGLRARGSRSVLGRRRLTGRRQLAGATRATRATRAEARRTRSARAEARRRTVRGSHPRAIRPGVLPPSAVRTPGSAWLEHHAVVMAVIAVSANAHDHGAGEEDGGEDENDPGDDHYPCCGHVDPGGLDWLVRRRRWRRSYGGGLWGRWGFRCVAHALNTAPVPNRDNRFRRQKLL